MGGCKRLSTLFARSGRRASTLMARTTFWTMSSTRGGANGTTCGSIRACGRDIYSSSSRARDPETVALRAADAVALHAADQVSSHAVHQVARPFQGRDGHLWQALPKPQA